MIKWVLDHWLYGFVVVVVEDGVQEGWNIIAIYRGE